MSVGRPLSLREVRALLRAHLERPTAGGGLERVAAQALMQARRACLTPLVPAAPELPLDEATWRLGAAVHNLLALAHPRVATGPGAELRVRRVAEAATELAAVGAPASMAETLARHSLLSRLWEIRRRDHTVRFWLGTRTFVGRSPPGRVLALPRVRGVRVETVRRIWLRDVGVHAAARPAFAALTEASPLGEALDPLRLDPPVSWERLLTVLRFPAVARLVAGRVLQVGVTVAGDALAESLYRYGAVQLPDGPDGRESLAFALAFLAHVVWLDHLLEPTSPFAGGRGARTPGVPFGSEAFLDPEVVVPEGAGSELATLLSAAVDVRPELVWPPDVPRESALGQRFERALARVFEQHQVDRNPRRTLAVELARRAGATPGSLPPQPEGMGYKGGLT